MKKHLNDRIRGVLYGQAVGDALGLGTEFLTREDVQTTYPEMNAEAVCRITHADPRCEGSCVIISLLISVLLQGDTDTDGVNECRIKRCAATR